MTREEIIRDYSYTPVEVKYAKSGTTTRGYIIAIDNRDNDLIIVGRQHDLELDCWFVLSKSDIRKLSKLDFSIHDAIQVLNNEIGEYDWSLLPRPRLYINRPVGSYLILDE